MPDTDGKKTVNDPSLDYEEMEAKRRLPRDLVGGTEAMRAAGSTWTPKLKDETDDELKERLGKHYLVDFYDSAVTDLVDRMFSGGITLEGAPERVLELWENIDGQGRSGDKFFYDVALDSARYGLSDVQGDFPTRPDAELSEAEEQRLGLAPFLVHRKARSVIAVEQTEGGGLPKIQRARIRECVVERKGYDEKQIEQVRELIRGETNASYQLWRQNEKHEWEPFGPPVEIAPPNSAPPEVAAHFAEVFLVPFYMGFERFHVAWPQWEKAAWLCLQHWQKKGDVDWIEHLANTPSLVHKGGQELKVNAFGSRRVVEIGADDSIEWLVIDPKGIDASKASIEHLEEHIRLVTRQPMVRKATGQDLVGVRQLDETRPMTRAQMWALGIAQSITQCLDMLAWWRGLPSGGVATFPEDALKQLVRPEDFDKVLKMGTARLLSKRAVQEEAKRQGVIDEDHDVDADLSLLEADAPVLPDFGNDAGDAEGTDA